MLSCFYALHLSLRSLAFLLRISYVPALLRFRQALRYSLYHYHTHHFSPLNHSTSLGKQPIPPTKILCRASLHTSVSPLRSILWYSLSLSSCQHVLPSTHIKILRNRFLRLRVLPYRVHLRTHSHASPSDCSYISGFLFWTACLSLFLSHKHTKYSYAHFKKLDKHRSFEQLQRTLHSRWFCVMECSA